MRLLLEAGACVERSDKFGITPLARACRSGEPEAVRMLLDWGADPSALDKPINSWLGMYISPEAYQEIVRLLESRGVEARILRRFTVRENGMPPE